MVRLWCIFCLYPPSRSPQSLHRNTRPLWTSSIWCVTLLMMSLSYEHELHRGIVSADKVRQPSFYLFLSCERKWILFDDGIFWRQMGLPELQQIMLIYVFPRGVVMYVRLSGVTFFSSRMIESFKKVRRRRNKIYWIAGNLLFERNCGNLESRDIVIYWPIDYWMGNQKDKWYNKKTK